MDINSNYTNGLWFKKDGSYCLIDENKFGSTDQSPTKCLVTFVKNILLHEPEVRDWIGTNPPKSSIDESEAEMWWKKVMVVMIQNGWNLAWAGCIHTNLDAKELTKVLKKVPQLVFEKGQLEWPYNGILTIQNLDDDEYQISWGALLGKESNVESVEQIPKLPDNSNLITRLEKLKILFEEKLISTEEYLAKKKKYCHNFNALIIKNMRKYEIKYRLIKFSNTPHQKTIIMASDPTSARRIFEQQNPGCAIIAIHEIK